MNVRILAAAIFAAVLVSGCGGGGGTSSPPPPGIKLTRVFETVNWPARSRDITALSSALSVNIVMTNAAEAGTDFVWNIDRGSTTTSFAQRYTSTTTAKVGTWDVTVKLMTLAGGQGSVVAQASGTATITENGTGLPAMSLTTKIAKVTVSGNRNIPVGQPKDLPFSATDAGGNVIPVSVGSAIWTVVVGQESVQFVNGQAKGLANGTATVKATVDGITSDPAFITVGTTDGTLTVNIKDPTGSLVPKATVTLFQSGVQVKQATPTTGTVTFAGISQGNTDVHVSSTGYHDGQATTTVVHTPTPVANVTITPAGAPIATNVGARLISTSGNTATIETDVAVTDENGLAISGLDPSIFTIDPIIIGGSTHTFQQVSNTYVDPDPQGNFDAFLLADATGNIRGSDPSDSRIEGMKAFYGLMPNGSDAMFGYFPSTNNAVTMKTYPQIGFVGNGTPYYPLIDGLRDIGFLGTPLYNATIQAIDLTAAVNSNSNKAVIVLTDGHQTNNAATLAQAVAHGKNKNVRVFTVSLGLQTYAVDMAELAQRTGGGTALATNSTQLTSLYRSLPALLRGRIKVYRVRWSVVRESGEFPIGSTVGGNIKINTSDGLLLAPYFLPVK